MNWLEFLDLAFGGDALQIKWMQRMVGYASLGFPKGHIVACVGDSRDAKVAFFNGLLMAMDPGAVVYFPDRMLRRDGLLRQGPSPEIAMLKGAFLAVFDLPRGIEGGMSLSLNTLASGEVLVGRQLWARSAESFPNSATPFLILESIPLPESLPENLCWRIRRVVFASGVQLPDGILADLRGDADAIRSWVEVGTREWREHGLEMPTSAELKAVAS